MVIRGINLQTLVTKVQEVFAEYGEGRQVEFQEMDGVKYDQTSLQVRLRGDAVLPVFIFAKAMGAGIGMEELERWELDFRGRPRVCYSCFRTGHLRQQCPQGVTRASLNEGAPNSYARVVRGPRTQEEMNAEARRVARVAEELRMEDERNAMGAEAVEEQQRQERAQYLDERRQQEEQVRLQEVRLQEVETRREKKEQESQHLLKVAKKDQEKHKQEEQKRLQAEEARRKQEEQEKERLLEVARKGQEQVRKEEVYRNEQKKYKIQEKKQEKKKRAADSAGRDLENVTTKWQQQKEEDKKEKDAEVEVTQRREEAEKLKEKQNRDKTAADKLKHQGEVAKQCLGNG